MVLEKVGLAKASRTEFSPLISIMQSLILSPNNSKESSEGWSTSFFKSIGIDGLKESLLCWVICWFVFPASFKESLIFSNAGCILGYVTLFCLLTLDSSSLMVVSSAAAWIIAGDIAECVVCIFCRDQSLVLMSEEVHAQISLLTCLVDKNLQLLGIFDDSIVLTGLTGPCNRR